MGYIFYGKYVTKVFGPDDRETPATAINDGVDYVPIPMAVYYPIAVVVGIVAALAFLAIFKKKTAKYASSGRLI